jgi:hypothetical protein
MVCWVTVPPDIGAGAVATLTRVGVTRGTSATVPGAPVKVTAPAARAVFERFLSQAS